MKKFDPKEQYGAYGAMGVTPEDIKLGLVGGACCILSLPYDNVGARRAVEDILEKQMLLAIPVEYQHKVKWIKKAPPESGLGDHIGMIGWRYDP